MNMHIATNAPILEETIRWVSVLDRLPDDDLVVLVCIPDLDDVEKAWLDDGWWRTEYGAHIRRDQVTHWARLPSGPTF